VQKGIVMIGKFWLSLLLLMLSVPALATVDVADVRFDDSATVSGQLLQLNGVGLRTRFFFKIYTIGLYLPKKTSSADVALAEPGAKRIRFVMMRTVPAEDMVEAFEKALHANNSEADLKVLDGRLDQFKQLLMSFGKARQGSEYLLDYVPGVGTHLTVDGVIKDAPIPGADLFQALMRAWLGPSPVQENLKEALLGKRVPGPAGN
jgi:hypothetical protein